MQIRQRLPAVNRAVLCAAAVFLHSIVVPAALSDVMFVTHTSSGDTCDT